jgi:hypothetical protein
LNGDGVERKLEAQRFAEEEHARKRSHPIVGQETDDYDNYTVYKEPFSKTEDYLKMNYFIIGMKLADTYKFTDPCLNNVVGAADSSAYFENHMYDHEKLMETGERSTYFQPYLNYTGSIAGPYADSLPNCYNFAYSVYDYESNRFKTFGSSWGNFFLAFLFNQMGNALAFQTKFERIKDEKERQNFAGVYQEYGDLVYLIWNFSPIEDGSLEQMEGWVEQWLHDHEYLNEEMSDTKKTAIKVGVSTLGRFAHSAGETFGTVLAAAGATAATMMPKPKEEPFKFVDLEPENLMTEGP